MTAVETFEARLARIARTHFQRLTREDVRWMVNALEARKPDRPYAMTYTAYASFLAGSGYTPGKRDPLLAESESEAAALAQAEAIIVACEIQLRPLRWDMDA